MAEVLALQIGTAAEETAVPTFSSIISIACCNHQ